MLFILSKSGQSIFWILMSLFKVNGSQWHFCQAGTQRPQWVLTNALKSSGITWEGEKYMSTYRLSPLTQLCTKWCELNVWFEATTKMLNQSGAKPDKQDKTEKSKVANWVEQTARQEHSKTPTEAKQKAVVQELDAGGTHMVSKCIPAMHNGFILTMRRSWKNVPPFLECGRFICLDQFSLLNPVFGWIGPLS